MAKARWLDDTEMDAWRALIETTSRLLAVLDDELNHSHGLSLADYEVLLHLAAAPDERMRMTELADRVLVSRSGLTRRVDGLERRKLVRREACPSDRRGANAVLTKEGRKALERAAPTHVDGVRRHFFDHLSPRQIETLAATLRSVTVPAHGGQRPGDGGIERDRRGDRAESGATRA